MTTVTGFLEEHWLGMLQTATSMLVLWGWWSLKRLFVTREDFSNTQAETDARFNVIEAKQAQRDNDISALREKLESIPGKDFIHALEIKMADIQAEMLRSNEEVRGGMRAVEARINGVDTRLAALSNQLDMIIQHHVETSK